MKHKKRIIAIILSFMMVIAGFPLSAFAERQYAIWVQGIQITGANKDDVLDDGGRVKFNPENNTLTLNNATIIGAKAHYDTGEDSNFGIEAFTDLSIELVNNNRIIAEDGFWSVAIFVTKPLTIFGSGSLEAIGGDGNEASIGISVDSALTIESGTIVAKANRAGMYSVGIIAGRDNDGIMINGGTITATGGTSPGSCGISLASSITINGGTITAAGGTSINGEGGIYSEGIIVNGENTVEINGGTITATGGTSPGSSVGIINSYGGTIIMNDGVLTAIGGISGTHESCGMRGHGETTIIRGGTITAMGKTRALELRNDLNIENPTDFAIMVNTDPKAEEAILWDNTTALNGDNSPYKYVKIIKSLIKHTLSFDANGGSGIMPEASVNNGGRYILPNCGFTPPEGKVFEQWEVGGIKYNVGDTLSNITADLSVKALWKDKSTPPTPFAPSVPTSPTEPAEYKPVSLETSLNGKTYSIEGTEEALNGAVKLSVTMDEQGKTRFSFLDKEGNKVKTKGAVKLTMPVKEGMSPPTESKSTEPTPPMEKKTETSSSSFAPWKT